MIFFLNRKARFPFNFTYAPPPHLPPPKLRHPSILAYRDSMEIEERAGVTVYLVTEPCRPLKETLGELVLPPGEK